METPGVGASEQQAPEDSRNHVVRGSLAHSSVSLPKTPTNIPPCFRPVPSHASRWAPQLERWADHGRAWVSPPPFYILHT